MKRAGKFLPVLWILWILLAVLLLVACSSPQPAPVATPTRAPAQTVVGEPAATGESKPATGESAARAVVEGFGKRLQLVSLLSPSASQDIQAQYAGFAAPALLEAWAGNPSQAPGRAVSSPWPERIEISSIAEEQPGIFTVEGFVVEVTGAQVVNGGAAERIPVHITVRQVEGRWLITEYAEEW